MSENYNLCIVNVVKSDEFSEFTDSAVSSLLSSLQSFHFISQSNKTKMMLKQNF